MTKDVHMVHAWDPSEGAHRVRRLFRETFHADPLGVWQAPGRVNLIGEHTDYNGGVCLPIALPHRTYAAVSTRSDRRVRLISAQEEGIREVDLDQVGPHDSLQRVEGWPAYVVGVLWALEQDGYGPLPGLNVAIDSCVPFGAGLSSSAALECAIAVAIDELAECGLAGSNNQPAIHGRDVLVRCCIRAENDIAGASTGGLDQSASLLCQEGHALFVDFLHGDNQAIPFDLSASGKTLLVIDTKAPHSLNDGQYASRRASCEEAAKILGVNFLAEITDSESALAQLHDPTHIKRVRHVLSEIARTREVVALMQEGPLESERMDQIAQLFNASHDSLRDDYTVSCPELDCAVDVARAMGAHGARMTGGGFGGSAIAICDEEAREVVAEEIAAEFARQGFHEPAFLVATAQAPAGREE